VLGAGSSLVASSSASKSAKNAANANNTLQAQVYAQNQQALAPFENDGRGATDQLARLLGLGDSATGTASNPYTAVQQQQGAIQSFQDSAPYQAEHDAGLKSVQAALGSKGLLDSGAAMKSLDNYGDQFLSSKLNTYEGQLAALSGTGLSAASAQAGVGQGYANATSANNNAAAAASGNAALSGANSVNSALGSALTAYGYSQGLGSSYGGTSTTPSLTGWGI